MFSKINFIIWLVFISSNVIMGNKKEIKLEYLDKLYNYDTALKMCKVKGMEVIRITDDVTEEMVHKFAIDNKLDKYWIEGKNKWSYNDGSPLIYNNWYTLKIQKNDNCLYGDDSIKNIWLDVSCDFKLSVICYYLFYIANFKENQLEILPDLSDQSTAINRCKDKGMRLVRIQTEEINTMVYNFAMSRNVDNYWIDGDDSKIENVWLYSDGTPLTFYKWSPGQPDNYKTENCIHCVKNRNSFWNDIPCNTKFAVICYHEK